MREVIKIPVFCESPLNGFFRFEDFFQIYPFKSNYIEIPDDALAKPFMLEFSYEKLIGKTESSFLTKSATAFGIEASNLNYFSHIYNESIRILNFLTTVTNFHFFYYTKKQQWIRGNNEEKSTIGFRDFEYPQLKEEHPLNINKFSEDLPFEPLEIHEFDKYIIEGTYSYGEAISFHSKIQQLLSRYYSLSAVTKRKIDSICRLYKDALNLHGTSKSIPFVVFTSCIEALTEIEFEKGSSNVQYSCESCKTLDSSEYLCKECGKPIWGMSFKFKEILRRYVEDSATANKLYNKWYGLRSEIVHNGKLFIADIEVTWDEEEKLSEQSITLKKIKQITRIAIINWLLDSEMAK